jgi:hypothetical protein
MRAEKGAPQNPDRRFSEANQKQAFRDDGGRGLEFAFCVFVDTRS